MCSRVGFYILVVFLLHYKYTYLVVNAVSIAYVFIYLVCLYYSVTYWYDSTVHYPRGPGTMVHVPILSLPLVSIHPTGLINPIWH